MTIRLKSSVNAHNVYGETHSGCISKSRPAAQPEGRLTSLELVRGRDGNDKVGQSSGGNRLEEPAPPPLRDPRTGVVILDADDLIQVPEARLVFGMLETECSVCG